MNGKQQVTAMATLAGVDQIHGYRVDDLVDCQGFGRSIVVGLEPPGCLQIKTGRGDVLTVAAPLLTHARGIRR